MPRYKTCTWGRCFSDSRNNLRPEMEGVFFTPFPNPKKFPEEFKIWVDACGRDNFGVKNITRDSYICSLHFVGGKGPTYEHQHPVAATRKETRKRNFRPRKACAKKSRKAQPPEVELNTDVSQTSEAAQPSQVAQPSQAAQPLQASSPKESSTILPEVPVQNDTIKRLNPNSKTNTLPLPLPIMAFQNNQTNLQGNDMLVSSLLSAISKNIAELNRNKPEPAPHIMPAGMVSKSSELIQVDTRTPIKVEPQHIDTYIKVESEDVDTQIKEEPKDMDIQINEAPVERVVPVLAFVNIASAPEQEKNLPAPYVTLPSQPSGAEKVDASTQTCDRAYTKLLIELRLLKREVEEKDSRLKLYECKYGLNVQNTVPSTKTRNDKHTKARSANLPLSVMSSENDAT